MNKTILIYGDGGTFKTSNAGQFAEYQYRVTGKPVRMITADSGTSPVEEQIAKGVIQCWNIKTAKQPIGCLFAAVRGKWPMYIDATGQADEATIAATKPEEWKEIGGYIIEGFTAMGAYLLMTLVKDRREVGEPLVGGFEEMGEKFAGASRGTYQLVQNQTYRYMQGFAALPVPRILFTAHEGKGEDFQHRPTFGPAIVGKAGMGATATWCETTLHHESFNYIHDVGGQKIMRPGVRAYFIRHSDPEIATQFWPAKLGVTPRIMASVLREYPEGYYDLILDENGDYVSSIATLLELTDGLEAEHNAPYVIPAAPVVPVMKKAGKR